VSPRPARAAPARDPGGRTPAAGGGLGHRSITSTAVYTALARNRFKDFWRDRSMEWHIACVICRVPSRINPAPDRHRASIEAPAFRVDPA
jgi:hypothetical protein